MRGNPFPLHHELSVQIKVVGNRKKLKVGLGSLTHTPPPRSPGWRKKASQKRGVGSGVRIWRVSLAHRWLVPQCPLLSADGFQRLLAIEAWRRQEEGDTVHYRHHCAPHGAQAVVQGAGQHQPQLFCSLEMETGAGSIMQSVLPTSRGSPASCPIPCPAAPGSLYKPAQRPSPPHLCGHLQTLANQDGIVYNVVVGKSGPLGAASSPLRRQASDSLAFFSVFLSYPWPPLRGARGAESLRVEHGCPESISAQ